MNNTSRESLTFVAPAFAVYAFVVLAPVAATVVFSFFSGSISSDLEPAGLSNYTRLLSDSVFYRAFGHNLALAGASVVVQLPIALGFALAFQSDNHLSRSLRSLVFSPMILPSTVIAVLFMLIYDPVSGPLSVLFRDIFGSSPAWLGEEAWVLPSLIVAISWRYIGFHMILMLSAVQAVDRSLYEAASLDGAGMWLKFRHVTLPSIAPTLLLSALLAVLGSLKYFDLVYVMTSGGPNHASELLSTYLFDLGINRASFGYSSAVATALLLASVIAGVLVYSIRTQRRVR